MIEGAKPLKIAMLGHKRIPSREGGIEIVVEELATRMAALGHEVTCYNRKGHHVSGKKFDTSHLSEYKGVKLRWVFTIDKRGLAAMTSSLSATTRATFGKYDIIHFHAEGPCAMLWLPHLFGKRTVVTIHGLDWKRSKWGGFATRYIKFGEKMAAKYADEIIVLSKGVQDYFKETYNRETRFIPNGVNLPVTREIKLLTEQFSLEKDEYILFLGRIVPEKGIKYLIEAFKQVKTDKKLVIAGGASDTGELIDELKELAKEDERIIFTGFVQGQLLEELYSNAYLYVLPSDLEGMPLSLLEAMSYGNCCLVSDIDECTEVIEDRGVVFKKGDIDKLEQSIQVLCNSVELVSSYRDKSAVFICQKYNWGNVVTETINLYRNNKG